MALLFSFDGLRSFGWALRFSFSASLATSASLGGLSNPKRFLFCCYWAFGGLTGFFGCSLFTLSTTFEATALAGSACCLVDRLDLAACSGSCLTDRSFLEVAASGTVAGVLTLLDGAETSAFALVGFSDSAAASTLAPLVPFLAELTSASTTLFVNLDFD